MELWGGSERGLGDKGWDIEWRENETDYGIQVTNC